MALQKNEIAPITRTVVKLNDDTYMMLIKFYHTADKEAKRNKTDKSFYRYEGKVFKEADFKAKMDEYKSDAHAMETWTWPTKDGWWKPEYFIAYYGDKTKKMASKWYTNAFKKHISWNDFLKLANDGVKMTAKGPKSSNSRIELTDYVTDDGVKFNIDTAENMAKLVGKTFGHALVLKRDLPKA